MSDKEKIDRIVSKLWRKPPALIRQKTSDSGQELLLVPKLVPDTEQSMYQSMADFFLANPNCCSLRDVNPLNTEEGRLGFDQRFFSSMSGYVAANYEVRYRDSADHIAVATHMETGAASVCEREIEIPFFPK